MGFSDISGDAFDLGKEIAGQAFSLSALASSNRFCMAYVAQFCYLIPCSASSKSRACIAGMISAHWPERLYRAFIINVPGFFSILWKLVEHMMAASTRRKIRLLRGKNVRFSSRHPGVAVAMVSTLGSNRQPSGTARGVILCSSGVMVVSRTRRLG